VKTETTVVLGVFRLVPTMENVRNEECRGLFSLIFFVLELIIEPAAFFSKKD
jgi:hypothetical protein